jgi:hypothetical protein
VVLRAGSWSTTPPLTLDVATTMNNIIYMVGAIVIVIALLSFVGLR